MQEINRRSPRTLAEMFKSCGGHISLVILAIGFGFALARFNQFGTDGFVDAFGFPALFLCIGAGLFWNAMRLATDAIAARDHGREFVATVESMAYLHEVASGPAAFSRKGRLRWFHPDYGTGQSLMHPPYYAAKWQPGDKITVYQGAQKTWWEGDVGRRLSTDFLVSTSGRLGWDPDPFDRYITILPR